MIIIKEIRSLCVTKKIYEHTFLKTLWFIKAKRRKKNITTLSRFFKVIFTKYALIRTEKGVSKMKEVPIWEKSNLTLEEAAAYYGIGINKLRELANGEDCTFVLWCGSKRLIKRKKLDEYLERTYSI